MESTFFYCQLSKRDVTFSSYGWIALNYHISSQLQLKGLSMTSTLDTAPFCDYFKDHGEMSIKFVLPYMMSYSVLIT